VDKIVIDGGKRLEGEVTVSGAKNSALPLMFSALLTDQPVHLRGVPDVADIRFTRVLPEQLEFVNEQMDRKKMWLWGSLVLAVLVIIGMAWRLTRQLPAPGEAGKRRPPYAAP
jgi:UDP-N-acetylglucosamine enolpyruvyl transferase